MEQTITKILEDLHRLDPGFDMNDSELRKIVTALVQKRPDTYFDEQFALRLRKELVKSISPTSPLVSPYHIPRLGTQFSFSFLHSKLFPSVAGALVAILLVAPLTYEFTKRSYEQSPETIVKNISSGLSLKQQISSKTNNAFGKLAYVTPQPAIASTNTTVTPKTAAIAPMSMAMQSTSSRTTSQMESQNVQPVYNGEPITLSETEGKVYKRVKGIDAGKQLANFLKNANFNVVNMNAFSKLSLETIQLSEDIPFGQTLGINFNDGIISINPNPSQWSGENKKQLTTSDIPADSKLIEIATNYVKDHGIDVSGYGQPIIERNTPGTIPEAMIVTYPLIIDGLEVYEQSGTPYGMQIVIDLHQQKVSSVNNLTSQLYESSLYNLETNSLKILKAAGATSSAQNKNSNGPTLQTPKKILMRYYSDPNNELYIPALLFGVQGKGIVQNNIVIPLVKDALDTISIASPKEEEPQVTATSTPTISTSTKEQLSTSTNLIKEDTKITS